MHRYFIARFAVTALAGVFFISCAMYRSRVIPDQRLVKAATPFDRPIILDVEQGREDANANLYDFKAADLEKALRISGQIRCQENSRLAVRYSIDRVNKDESFGVFILTLGILPSVTTLRSIITFELYDRSTAQVLLTYAYRVERISYRSWINMVVAPVSGALEQVFGDPVESVSNDETNVHLMEMAARRFYLDLTRDSRTPALAAILTSGERVPETRVIVMPFKGPGGELLSSAVEMELINRNVHIVVRKNDELKTLLSMQSLEQSGLIATAAAIGKMTGATSLLLGEIQQNGAEFTIRARLIHLERAELLWGHDYTERNYSRTPDALLREIAKKIGAEMARANRH